jgi:hypothetical protein
MVRTNLMRLDGVLDITRQDLEPRPECCERISHVIGGITGMDVS